MSKTLIVEDDCELLKQVEKYPNEVQVFDTPLEAIVVQCIDKMYDSIKPL